MSDETNVLVGGNDDANQKTRQFVNVNQNNSSYVYVVQDPDQIPIQGEIQA
ncbi:MAG TPA: hypothetical protein VEC37_10050 [Bacillota bacterium]|nr:hypothetical protein [Bacillota bacterium]